MGLESFERMVCNLVQQVGISLTISAIRLRFNFLLRFEGEIDRERLGELVFIDVGARRQLNRATHPAVTFELAKQLLVHFLRGHWLVVGRPLLLTGI